MMFPPRPTELAHQLLRGVIRAGDLLIDATAGNGHDTLFLAECAGPSGKVIAFDIQEAAIESSRRRIVESGFAGTVEFHRCCHAEMECHAAAETVGVAMFNLGYLPGMDHAVTTEREATLRAIDAATRLIRPGGVLSVVCYPGHDTGRDESAATRNRVTALSSAGWRVSEYRMLGTLRPAPFLLMAQKGGRSTPPPRQPRIFDDSGLPAGNNPLV